MLPRHFVTKCIKIRIIKKQLRDHIICPRVNLLLEIAPIHVLATFASDVPFWETSHADRNVLLLANKPHQLTGKLEPSRRQLKLSPSRLITTQGQNIFYAQCPNLA